MVAGAKPCPDDCVAHSGHTTLLKEFGKFQDRQEGKDGVNQRLWETLEKINQKQNWILGGVSALAFAIMAVAGIIASIHFK